MNSGGNGINIKIDGLTNCLIENATNREIKTDVKKISILKPAIYKDMSFDWVKEFKSDRDVYSLHIKGRLKTEGLIAIIPPNPNDEAINITLAESAPHNRGENPIYKGVGSHLFAIASFLSFLNGFEGYVMFEAKTKLIQHYKETLGAYQIGSSQRMILVPENSKILVQHYFPDRRKGW